MVFGDVFEWGDGGGLMMSLAQCMRCWRVFEVSLDGCPDCNRGKVSGDDWFWDWRQAGWVEEGTMLVWGDLEVLEIK